METNSGVAVVILNWNGEEFLSRFLPSLLAHTPSYVGIFVADNASTDGSVSLVREQFPQVRLILLDTNYGFAGGYNEALKRIDARYYALLNSDVLVTPQWIEPLIDLLDKDEQVAACQPIIRSYHRRDQFEYAGAAGGWIDRFGYPFCRGRIFDNCETDHGQYNEAEPVFWASGAAMLVRAKAFQEAGGFDAFFFAHQEEIDLCWRLQRAGYLILAQPASVVYHVGGGTLPTGSYRKLYLNFRNNLVMLAKNLPVADALWIISARMALDLVASIRGVFTGDITTTRAIHAAHIHFCKWLFRKKHPATLPKKERAALAGTYSGSIVWQYFVRSKKTFLEIVRPNN